MSGKKPPFYGIYRIPWIVIARRHWWPRATCRSRKNRRYFPDLL